MNTCLLVKALASLFLFLYFFFVLQTLKIVMIHILIYFYRTDFIISVSFLHIFYYNLFLCHRIQVETFSQKLSFAKLQIRLVILIHFLLVAVYLNRVHYVSFNKDLLYFTILF